MHLFKNIKLGKKIALLSTSFLIFLIIIGFAGVKQISKVNSMVVELYDSRLVPIVYLQDIKSDMEYIRSTDNKLMDATDDPSKKSIQGEIETVIASMKERLSKFKNDPNYKDILDNFDKFVTANDAFIKTNGVGAVKQQSAAPGPPTDMITGRWGLYTLSLKLRQEESNKICKIKMLSGISTKHFFNIYLLEFILFT